MTTPAYAAIWFLPFILPIAAWVAVSDLRTMKIPNKAVLAVVGVFLVVGFFVLPLPDWGWRWVNLVVVLLITFLLNLIGQMGAGDAKYMAAMAPFVAWEDAGTFMVLLALTAVVSLLLKWSVGLIPAVRRKIGHWESYQRSRVFPYGLALSLTFVLYLVLCILYGRPAVS